MRFNFAFSGREICSLMRSNGVTIKALSQKTGITMRRIREIRTDGVSGHAACDWYEAITGELRQDMREAYIRFAKSQFTHIHIG